MIGAIAGDVVGSPYEHRPHKSVDFPLLRRGGCFPPDPPLALATARPPLSRAPPPRPGGGPRGARSPRPRAAPPARRLRKVVSGGPPLRRAPPLGHLGQGP